MPAETGCPDSREFYDEYGCSFDVYVECDYNTMSCDLGTDPYTVRSGSGGREISEKGVGVGGGQC